MRRIPFKAYPTLFVVCWCWAALGVICYIVNEFVHWRPLNLVGATGLLAFVFAMLVGIVSQLLIEVGPFGSTLIEVRLGHEIDEVRTVIWPSVNSAPADSCAISDKKAPFRVKLLLPKGREFVSKCRAVVLYQQKGKVNHVALTPFTKSFKWSAALAEMARNAARLGVKDHTGFSAIHGPTCWQPRQDCVSEDFNLDDNVQVHVELQPHPVRQGYFSKFEYTFAANDEGVQVIALASEG